MSTPVTFVKKSPQALYSLRRRGGGGEGRTLAPLTRPATFRVWSLHHLGTPPDIWDGSQCPLDSFSYLQPLPLTMHLKDLAREDHRFLLYHPRAVNSRPPIKKPRVISYHIHISRGGDAYVAFRLAPITTFVHRSAPGRLPPPSWRLLARSIPLALPTHPLCPPVPGIQAAHWGSHWGNG